MKHVAEGQLRRYLDEPASLDDASRAHLAGCPQCQASLDTAAGDRELVGAQLSARLSGPSGTAGEQGDVDAAWHRLTAALQSSGTAADGGPAVVTPFRRRTSRWQSLRRPVVGVAVAAVVAVGTTAAAVAADWLPLFQPDQVKAVTFDVSQVQALPDLSAYGTVDAANPDGPEPVASAAEAQSRTGIAVLSPSHLPDGVTGSPSYAVMPKLTGDFTFSAAKARAAAERTGQALPAMPAGMDGSSLRLDAGPGVLTTWGASSTGGSGDRSFPEFAVLQTAAPHVSAQGVSLATLRDYLLAQPGIPAGTADQLRKLPDDGTVLPVPVPEQYATARTVTVDGVQGTLLELRDGSGAGMVWIKDGQLTAVVGLVSAQDIQDAVRDLH